MTLSTRFEAGPSKFGSGTPCSVGTALSALPAQERVALQKMLDDRAWSQAAIHQALRDERINVGQQSIGRHRRRQCRCFL
jgi:hypothetical protein